jgi:DNA-binding transcriptional MerR regulator
MRRSVQQLRKGRGAVRIGELSAASGVPLPTIKYYLREGLVPAGSPTARNQADYGPEHLARLRLVRALIEVGGLSVAAARDVLRAVDDPDLHAHELLGVAHDATVAKPVGRRDTAEWRLARDAVDRLVGERHWLVHADAPALDQAADALAAFATLGATDFAPLVDVWAEAAEKVARQEVAAVAARESRAATVEGAVIGTVIGEVLFNALRRLAQEHASAAHYGFSPEQRPC